ncbi:MAG: hypothetical protein ACR2NA_12340 [Solirubrobacterales bacterium]
MLVPSYLALALVSDSRGPARPLPPTVQLEITAFDLLSPAVLIGYAVAGGLVASRLPRNPVGWLLGLVALSLGFAFVAERAYRYTVWVDPGLGAWEEPIFWVANWIWIPGLLGGSTLLLLLFPTGSLPSPGWRWVGRAAAAAAGVLWAGYALAPGPLADYPAVVNPVGIPGYPGRLLESLQVLGFAIFMATAILAAGSLVIRFRRSHGIERHQTKWVVFALVFALATLVFQNLPQTLLTEVVITAGLLAVPAAVAIAILRHRLYDIDVVINRTLVYAALTATLVGAYALGVLVLGAAVRPLTGDSDLAIAASTLLVAALFRPARSRIQHSVDRRFYRRKYDAERTLEVFAGTLRNEVELEALARQLRAAIAETVAPAAVGIWLSSPDGQAADGLRRGAHA